MQWLRNWLSKSGERPAKVSSSTSTNFRPKVESLDDRIVPTVSSAITNVGTFTVAVNTSNQLVALDAAGNQTQTGFTGVRTAQLFRTASGGLGADIVFQDGSWQHIDDAAGGLGSFTETAAQAKSQFGGLILDAGTAYNDKGQVRIDFLVSSDTMVDTNGNTFSDAVGSVMEFDMSAGGGLHDLGVGNNVQWVSTYNAADGGTGIALGQVTKNTQTGDTLLVRKADLAAGLTTLYNGFRFTPDAIVEYSQTTSLPTVGNNGLGGILGNAGNNANSASRMVLIDVTFEGSQTAFNQVAPFGPKDDTGYALQFTSGGSTSVGGLLGGTSGVANVVGIISSDNTIETGVLHPGETFHP
jgi:hypothetical protein